MHNQGTMTDFDVPEDLRALGRDTDRAWREEMAIRESDAELARTKERGFPDVAWEAMQRGDEVVFSSGDHTFRGHLVAVRNDFAMLTTGTATVGINLRVIDAIHCLRRPETEGRAGDRTFGSFDAYLMHLEADERLVRVLGRNGTIDVTGRLRAVADDHVLVTDADHSEWAVSLKSLAFIQDLRDS
jgi:hypothetical protein